MVSLGSQVHQTFHIGFPQMEPVAKHMPVKINPICDVALMAGRSSARLFLSAITPRNNSLKAHINAVNADGT